MKIPQFLPGGALCGLSLLFLGACHPKQAASDAQSSPTPGANGGFVSQAQAREQRMQTELGLSDDQVQKIRAIMEAGRSAREALRNDQSMTEEQRRAKFQEMHQESDTKVEAILTPDQVSKFEELRKQREAERGNRQNRGGGGDGQGQGQQPPAQQQ